LDEPTTGLHFHDIKLLLDVLHRLRDAGNTVLIIEHNMDVVKTADWVIDLGPEGGDGGGRVVAAGTPEAIAREKGSHTGRYLAQALQNTNGRAILAADEPGHGKPDDDDKGRAHPRGDSRRRAAHRQ
jgi:excinuclease ABC subunit A